MAFFTFPFTSIYMLCDQGDGTVTSTAVTVNTNAAGQTTEPEWFPTANEPFYWHTSLGTANPWLTPDITELHFNNDSGSTAVFKVRILLGTS